MKYAEPRPYADPEKAARRIVEIASTVEPAQDGAVPRRTHSHAFVCGRAEGPNGSQPVEAPLLTARLWAAESRMACGFKKLPSARCVPPVPADYRCSHSIMLDADRWPDDVRLSDIEPRF